MGCLGRRMSGTRDVPSVQNVVDALVDAANKLHQACAAVRDALGMGPPSGGLGGKAKAGAAKASKGMVPEAQVPQMPEGGKIETMASRSNANVSSWRSIESRASME